MLLLVYTTTWEIQSPNAMHLFLWSCPLLVDVLFSVFWLSKFSFSSLISWFQNIEIFPPFLRNSCDEIIWWFGVAVIVTVIFACRYFKLSWNTSALSQSNCRNFSGSSTGVKVVDKNQISTVRRKWSWSLIRAWKWVMKG